MEYTFERGYILKGGVKMSYAEVIDELHLLRLKADKWDELDEEVGELYSFIDVEADLETVGKLCATKLGYL
jgi:hypothetical protein